MPSGHGRDDYTFEKMLERRNRNNIRKVLERNGRRLTAKEIDIVNLCTRHPDQRYILFTYYSDANCMRLNPYVPHFSMLDHYLHHQRRHFKLQQNLGPSPDCDRSASTSFVAPLLLQLNTEVNAANDSIDRRSQIIRPSTSLVTLPCYFLTDRPEVSGTSTPEFNSTVNLIADTIVESLKSSSDKGNSEKDSFGKVYDENGSSDMATSRKSSRKNSKKKNRKKGGTKARLSKTQTRSDNNRSNESVSSSDFSSSCHVEISSVAGDECDQRVKSDTETILRCISNNMSDHCCANVSCSKSVLNDDDEGANMKLALSRHTGDAINEDPSTFVEMGESDQVQFSSNGCINNEFIPVVFGKRRRFDRRNCQLGNHAGCFSASNRRNGDQFTTWQEKPSKSATRDKATSRTKNFKPRSSRTETSMTLESFEKIDTSSKPDSSCSVSRHLGEYVFRKDDFPSLPSPDNDVIVRCKVRSRLTGREDLKNPHVPLPRKAPEQCKESESEVGVDVKFSIPILKVTIGDVEESGSGSGSSSGAYFSPDSSKSSEMNQSSHSTSSTDSPRSSKASDEVQVRSDVCYSDANEGHNVSQSGGEIFTSNDKSITDVTQSGGGTCLFDLNNNTPTDIDAFKCGSLTCSSPDSTTPVSPTNSTSCLNVGVLNNVPTIVHRDLEKILSAVRAAYKVYQIVEEVQATLRGPLADYELLCRCAAPVVGLPPRQIIEMPLRNIWQWYEEPSCYTLEVKGCQDPQQLVNFNAHFVPSLSAVQLFVRRGSSAIFSKHMPKQDGSEFAPCVEDVLSVNAGSAELVFEFFEHEQPYFRQTLFEKVKELIDGVAQGKSYVNGDAHNLEKLHIGDLHPASWYSVAWYPTYRIPESRSSFKAAFLTYHSLVHFVPRVASPPLVDDRVVLSSCPVAGLMSYSTQDESWYHGRFQTKGDVMEDRLESLNLTAAVMARAQVMKGDQVFMNHHPDFEFFASRQYPN